MCRSTLRAFAFVLLTRVFFILCLFFFFFFIITVFSFQIAEKLELLLTEREGLYATWEDHKTELDQAYDLHVFLRDAKQIDTLTSTQEVKSYVFLFFSEGLTSGSEIRAISGITRIKYRNRWVPFGVKTSCVGGIVFLLKIFEVFLSLFIRHRQVLQVFCTSRTSKIKKGIQTNALEGPLQFAISFTF